MGNKMKNSHILSNLWNFLKSNPKLLKEVFQGILSLSILVFVIILYFSNFNSNSIFQLSTKSSNSQPQIPITGYFLKNNSNPNSDHAISFNFPSVRKIILRLDDVQGFAWNNISINLTETILE